ncbi:MAG: hypothetical protein ACHQ49_13485 [Elusimicrobiota bacterium]
MKGGDRSSMAAAPLAKKQRLLYTRDKPLLEVLMILPVVIIAAFAQFSPAAHATNPCDADPKFCSDNLNGAAQSALSDAAKSGGTLKASQAYQGRITALMIRTHDASTKAQEYSDKAELWQAQALDHISNRGTASEPISSREADFWTGTHTSFDLNDRTLLRSLGYFKGVRDGLASGQLDEAALTKVEREVAATAHFVDNAAKAIDSDIAQTQTSSERARAP